jgi:hypothetical protein
MVATLAAVLIPAYTQITVPVASTASVGEVVIPIGHWIIIAAWTWAIMTMRPEGGRHQLARCIAIGLALHAVTLVALFVPRLADREAFSATVYLRYAQLFCIGVLSLCTAWVIVWIGRVRAALEPHALIEAPLVAGAIALSVAMIRHNAVMALLALAAGVALACSWWWARRRPALMTTIGTMTSGDGAAMAAIFIVALTLRLLYVSRIMSDANYLDAGSDGRVYDEMAWSIASGNGIAAWFAARFPLLLLGYIYFVAMVYKVAGHSYLAVTAIQSVLGAAACVLLFDMARRLFDRAVARVAAMFAAVSFPLLFAAATIGHQAVDVFITVAIVWLSVRLVSAQGDARWAAVGALVGFAVAVRETNVFFAAFLAAWIAATNAGGWRRAARPVAAFAAAAAVVVLPFLAPKIWTASDRAAMLAHFDRLYRAEGDVRSTRTDIAAPLTDPGAAWTQLRSEPVRVIGTLARSYAANLAAQFLTQPYGGFDLVFLRKGSEYYYGMWFYAYAFTIAGAIVAWRRRHRGGFEAAGAMLVLGVVASRTFPHVVLESDYRHRVPVEPFLILLASIGAVALCRAVIATAASASTSGFTGNDWRVSQSSGTWTPVT